MPATWEHEGEEWKNESEPDPEESGDLTGLNPTSFFEEQRRRFTERERWGSPVCPKCVAINEERRKQKLDPLPGHIRPRVDALWCYRCNAGVYQMSDDTVIRFDKRWHPPRNGDSPARGE